MIEKKQKITVKYFEIAIENSKDILEKLNNTEISLSDAMKYYKEGLKQLQEANKMLENAELEFIDLNKT